MILKILLLMPLAFSLSGCTQSPPEVPQRDGAFLRFNAIGTGAVVLEAVVISGQEKRVAAGDVSKTGGTLKRWSDTYVAMGQCGRIRFVFDREDGKKRFWKAASSTSPHQSGQGCQINDWQDFQWQEVSG